MNRKKPPVKSLEKYCWHEFKSLVSYLSCLKQAEKVQKNFKQI